MANYKSTTSATGLIGKYITEQQAQGDNERRESLLDVFGGLSNTSPTGYSRMGNDLNRNIAYKRSQEPYTAMTEAQQNKLTDELHIVDGNFKPVSLNVEEIRLVKVLSTYIPDNTINEFIVPRDKNHKPFADKMNTTIPINLFWLSKDIMGDTKEKSIRVIGERLLALASKEQCQIVWIDGERYIVTNPLISVGEKLYKLYTEVHKEKRGRNSTKEEKPILVAASVTLSAVFLNNVTNKFSPFHKDKYLEATKKNKTELFAILEADLGAKWQQYITNYHKTTEVFAAANKELRRSNRSEYLKQLEAESLKALTYKASVDTIKARVSTDYSGHRQAKARFWEHLNRAITSLIEYGIITDKTYISRDKKFVHFSYNPNFAKRD